MLAVIDTLFLTDKKRLGLGSEQYDAQLNCVQTKLQQYSICGRHTEL